MNNGLVFARRNEALNQWLEQNPAILGVIFIVLGLVLGGWGLYELTTGTARTKRGEEVTGGQATMLAGIRIVAGVVCIVFAIFKMIS